MILAGEPGIGKTRLAGELARAVQAEGALVLYGRCDDGLAVPYQPFVEALRPVAQAIGTRPPAGRARAPGARPGAAVARARGAGRAVPRRPGDRALPAVRGRHRAARGGHARAARVARARRPALGGPADAADAAPPHPLRAARSERSSSAPTARRSSRPTIRSPGSSRTCSATRARHGCASAGSTSARSPRCSRPRPGTRSTNLAAEFARVLQSETGGNPFFIREVLAHLVESGAVYRAGERWTTDLALGQLEVPEGLRQVIRHRVARLSEPARRALAVAAVAGPTFSLALLEAVVGEQAGLLDGLDEAVAAGLLTEAGAGRVRVRARARAPDDLRGAQRGAAHAAAPPARRGARGARPTSTRTSRRSRTTSRRPRPTARPPRRPTTPSPPDDSAAARLAYEDAAAHYERGLQALELAGNARRRAALRAAARARRRALERGRDRQGPRGVPPRGRARRQARRARALARAALGFAGPARFEVAAAVTRPLVGLLERALEALGDDESALRARVMARLAAALAFAGPDRRRPALAREALEIARRVGDNAALADVLASHHVATRGPNNFDERRAAHRELAHVAAEVGDGPRAALASSWILTDLLELGDIDEAEREFRALVAPRGRAATAAGRDSSRPSPEPDTPTSRDALRTTRRSRTRRSPSRSVRKTRPHRPSGHRCCSCAASRGGSTSSSRRSRASPTATQMSPLGAARSPTSMPSSIAGPMPDASSNCSRATTSQTSRATGCGS